MDFDETMLSNADAQLTLALLHTFKFKAYFGGRNNDETCNDILYRERMDLKQRTINLNTF